MGVQLLFKYGAMNSGKSIEILKTKHNYEEQGKRTLLFTTSTDNRSGKGKVSSRIGISSEALLIDELGQSVSDFVEAENNLNKVSCVLVDEAQFLLDDNVMDLVEIVDQLNIPVICYGLKNDFKNKLFEGSESLLLMADKIEEVKTVCSYCERKATCNLRVNDGTPIYHGKQIETGGNDKYLAVCRKHYYNPDN